MQNMAVIRINNAQESRTGSDLTCGLAITEWQTNLQELNVIQATRLMLVDQAGEIQWGIHTNVE